MMKNKKAIALAVSAMSVAGSVVPTFAAEESKDTRIAKPEFEGNKITVSNLNFANNKDVKYIEASNEETLEVKLKELELESKNPKIVETKEESDEIVGYFVEYNYNHGEVKTNEHESRKNEIIEYLNRIAKEEYQGKARYKIYEPKTTREYNTTIVDNTKTSVDGKVQLKETTIKVVDTYNNNETVNYKFYGEFDLQELGLELDSNIKETPLTASSDIESYEFKELSKEIYKLEQRIKNNNYHITIEVDEKLDTTFSALVKVYKSDKVTLVEEIRIGNLNNERENDIEDLQDIDDLKAYLAGDDDKERIAVIEKISLNDVYGHWAEEEILDAVLDKNVEGYLDGTFKPNQTITRAEFAKIICETFNLPEVNSDTEYTDVKVTEWYSKYVLTLDALGIVNGYEDKTFRPNQPITRQEAAVILATIEKGELDSEGKYKRVDTTSKNSNGETVHMDIKTQFDDDAQIPSWADESVQYLAEKTVKKDGKLLSIINGYADNTFRPANNITRAEAIKMAQIAKEVQ